MLRCVALCCVVLRCVALCCVVLRCVALCCVVSRSAVPWFSVLCCVALCCVVLRRVALSPHSSARRHRSSSREPPSQPSCRFPFFFLLRLFLLFFLFFSLSPVSFFIIPPSPPYCRVKTNVVTCFIRRGGAPSALDSPRQRSRGFRRWRGRQ